MVTAYSAIGIKNGGFDRIDRMTRIGRIAPEDLRAIRPDGAEKAVAAMACNECEYAGDDYGR